jgi:DNA topoisomerase-1
MPKKSMIMRQSLVIVESPAKCKKIEEYLGPGYKCLASFGHLRELKSLQNIDSEKNYEATYTIMEEKKKQIDLLKKEIKKVDEVVLACDADREGEAICFHLCEIFDLSIERTKRIVFHEITESAIQHAIQNPGRIDMNLVKAQQSRQILDLLVGFKLSPVLWKYISQSSEHSLSAGRCQTPALKLIYENQKEINHVDDLQKKVYRTIGYFTNMNLVFHLNKEYDTEDEMTDFLFGSISFKHEYSFLKPEKVIKKSPPPLITSTLQQKASNEFHYSPKETMKICQSLYEGGYITYMRTDSKVYSKEFVDSAKNYIKEQWGENYVSKNIEDLTLKTSQKEDESKVNGNVQEAHEAIRPTKLAIKELPNTILDTKERKMYSLIWEQTMESCMADSIYYSLTAKISAFDQNCFTFISEQADFLGWKIVITKYVPENKEYYYLQTITQGYLMNYKKMVSKITLINTKSHYTEARLIHLLEEKGIGRPSTFSSIVDKIQERGYVKKETTIKGKTIICKDFELEGEDICEIETTREFGNEKNKLVIQPLGLIVMDFLNKHFAPLFEYEYTKQMEKELDEIAQGVKTRQELCKKCDEEVNHWIQILKENENEKKVEFKIDADHSYVIGKYGPVIKCVEENKDTGKEITTFKPVKKDIDLDKLREGEYNLEELLEEKHEKKISEIVLGTHNGEQVILKKGKFGLYISFGRNTNNSDRNTNNSGKNTNNSGKNTKNLKEFGNRPIESIRFEEIEKYLEEGSNIIREISNDITIRKGPKGDYLFFKTSKMKKPQFYSLQGFKEDYKTCNLQNLKEWMKDTHHIS